MILAGFGGVTAEILQDVRLFTPDLTVEAIEREMLMLRQAPLLTGWRGSPALDIGAAARVIATLGRLLMSEPRIREVDLNPVIIHPAGEGVVALDALILLDRDDG